MSRTVIVLSPDEWNKRIELADALQQASDHTHYALTRVGNIKSALYGVENDIRKGINEGLEKQINQIMILTNGISTEIRNAQRIINELNEVTQSEPVG